MNVSLSNSETLAQLFFFLAALISLDLVRNARFYTHNTARYSIRCGDLTGVTVSIKPRVICGRQQNTPQCTSPTP